MRPQDIALTLALALAATACLYALAYVERHLFRGGHSATWVVAAAVGLVAGTFGIVLEAVFLFPHFDSLTAKVISVVFVLGLASAPLAVFTAMGRADRVKRHCAEWDRDRGAKAIRTWRRRKKRASRNKDAINGDT